MKHYWSQAGLFHWSKERSEERCWYMTAASFIRLRKGFRGNIFWNCQMSSLIASLNSSHGLVTQTASIISKQMILQLVPKIFFFKKWAPYSVSIYMQFRGDIWESGTPQRESVLEIGAAEGKGELLGWKVKIELGEDLHWSDDMDDIIQDMDDKDLTGGFSLFLLSYKCFSWREMSIFVAFDIFHIENAFRSPKQMPKRRWVPVLWLLIRLSVPYHWAEEKNITWSSQKYLSFV